VATDKTSMSGDTWSLVAGGRRRRGRRQQQRRCRTGIQLCKTKNRYVPNINASLGGRNVREHTCGRPFGEKKLPEAGGDGVE